MTSHRVPFDGRFSIHDFQTAAAFRRAFKRPRDAGPGTVRSKA